MQRMAASQQRKEVGEQPVRGAVFVAPDPPKQISKKAYFGGFKSALSAIFKPMLVIAAFFFAVQIAWQALKWVSLSDWTNPVVARIRIEAPFRWRTEAELKRRLVAVLQQRFWSLDVYALRHYLLQDPAFQKVSVEKFWPDEIGLVIEEVTPIARWGRGHVLTEQGKLVAVKHLYGTPEHAELFKVDPLELAAVEDDKKPGTDARQGEASALRTDALGRMPALMAEVSALPLLLGGQHRSADLIEHYRLLRRLGWPVAELELTARGAWKISLIDGLKIDLGSQNFSERVHKVAIIMQAYRDRLPEMQKIDARYPNGVAIQWRANHTAVVKEEACTKVEIAENECGQ